MGRKKRFGWEEETAKLLHVDALARQGKTITQACTETGIALASYYRWRRARAEFCPNPEIRVKDLEIENARLRKLVGDLSLEAAILRDRTKARP